MVINALSHVSHRVVSVAPALIGRSVTMSSRSA